MALKIFLRHPWYDPEGYYRRVEDNPHTVEVDLADIPSTAEIEGPKGEREKVWKLRGETDPATRSALLVEEQEARKVLPLARALTDPKRAVRDTEALEKENEQLRKDLEAAQKKLETASFPPQDNSPPIQQPEGTGTNAIPGSNPVTHGTQAVHPRDNSVGTDADGKPTKDPDKTDLEPLATKPIAPGKK